MLDKFPPWLIKLLSKIRSTLFPVLLCCVFFFASDVSASAAEFVQPTFAVEIHNYENNPSPIQYGSGAVLLTTNTSSQPVLEFDCVIPYGLLQNSSDFLVFNFICHSSIQDVTPAPTMYLECNLIDRYGTQSAVLYNTSSTLFEGSYGFSFTSQASQFSNFNKTQLARIRIKLTWPQGSSRFETCLMTMSAMISSSDGSFNEVVAAINNQTSSLGGKIDDTNDLINNGNENTGDLINDVSSANAQLNEIWGEYEEIEDGFIDDYESASADLVDDFTGFSWLGAGEAIIWVSERLSQIYVALGDFRMYILYPLLLGIAMLFIGRGQVILNNLSKRWYKDE